MIGAPPTATLLPSTRLFRSRGDPKPAGYGDAGPLLNDYLVAARRLVEAGARVVTLAYGRWDWHGKPYGTTTHAPASTRRRARSEGHTSELQSPDHLVCRLLL